MIFLSKKSKKNTIGIFRHSKIWCRIASVILCFALISTNMVGVSATEQSKIDNTIEQTEVDTTEKTEVTYTLYLTHYFRFTVNGKKKSISTTETLKLTQEDFKDGMLDLNRFAYDKKLLTVTEAKNISVEDFDEKGQGGARIVYAVKNGYKLVYVGDSAKKGSVLRNIFEGKLEDYEFVPANVIQMNMEYLYSNTGGLAGVNVADSDIVEAEPKKQSDGTYTLEWSLPTKDGFRIVMDPKPLNEYLVKSPTGDETAAELEKALERGDFNVDINNKTVYYYQEVAGQEINPSYNNRYSTEYNRAWNKARTLIESAYTATAVGDDNNMGANPLKKPKLKVTLTEEQLSDALSGKTKLNITVYYRRNATWYTVNHWVPKEFSGLTDDKIADKTTQVKDGTTYVLLDQETVQGRVGATTNAHVKTDGVYERLTSIGFSQKIIENTDTAVDVYYKAADSYRVIFDTNYTYIPRQQVDFNSDVDFTQVNTPTRTGYIFDGWQYLNKDAQPDANGEYAADAYTKVEKTTDERYKLTIDTDLISKAKFQETGGVLALHLYPVWKPAQTQVRVILWTENLTGKDDVQAKAEGGNISSYDTKYANYSKAPVTHEPEKNGGNSHYSNVGSFTMKVNTDSLLLENNNLIQNIQDEISTQFKVVMGTVNGIDVNQFYSQNSFEVMHEVNGQVDYTTTTASADGKTTIYVYFTRNIYTLQFHYYGKANGENGESDFSVAYCTNGYSYDGVDKVVSDDVFNYGYGYKPNDKWNGNLWAKANVQSDNEMPVPKTITIKAKYDADLKDVWPAAQTSENVATNKGNAKMISWSVTDGQYCADAMPGSGSSHEKEPTINGVYGTMSSEIIANPANTATTHHLVAYWHWQRPSYYRYNHCYEIPELDISSQNVIKISLYNSLSDLKNVLYLVPTDNPAFSKYKSDDLMPVSYTNGTITYDDPDGTYYAVRGYIDQATIKYYVVARRLVILSTNTIGQQNPSARSHMTRANANGDHTTQYTDDYGATNADQQVGSANDPYDLYFYYNRDRYTITYIAPTNKESTSETEVTLGTITLPYGTLVTQEKYGFTLDYKDTNQTKESGKNKYPWNVTGDAVKVCPDRSENGTAEWKFKGWGLGPAGVNMQWSMSNEDNLKLQAEDNFYIEANFVVYAIWEQPVYTVTFHLNGGSVIDDQLEVKVPANTRYSVNGAIPRPVRNGYTLNGWYISDENGNIGDSKTPFDFDMVITDNQHVTAMWDAASTETYNYNIYYVTKTLNKEDKDKTFSTVKIDTQNDKIVENGGENYYVLEKVEMKNQYYVSDTMLKLTTKNQTGYVPQQTDKILILVNPDNTYDVIFYYEPITTRSHTVRFVEAGTETGNHPNIVKTLQVEADQAVITPRVDAVKELIEKGYRIVTKDSAGKYNAVTDYSKLTWIDDKGNTRLIETLKEDEIPNIVTYLVQPISYTITYQNAEGSPSATNEALNAITASLGTPVVNAGNKNPTQYTANDNFTVKNPNRVYENGKWYQFSHWSLGDDTTVKGNETIFSTLKVDSGTVGNLIFIANWKEITGFGGLTVSKIVAGNAGEMDRAFHFKVTLNDTSINGIFGDMNFINGVAEITLKHGESKTATNLPEGINYKVEEVKIKGYTVTSTGEKGTIIKDVTATAVFTNTKNHITVVPETPNKPDKPLKTTNNIPKTSDESNLTPWMILMGASCIVIISTLMISHKKRKVRYKK